MSVRQTRCSDASFAVWLCEYPGYGPLLSEWGEGDYLTLCYVLSRQATAIKGILAVLIYSIWYGT